ncbi:2OG-Fe(II) oxygenase [Acinetobacter sp. ANC 4633]|uniref:2OG-Fe(II) oxygenase n=1 Tax=Acinetobacter sp. ANC 4633 TaxID=2529845 RepID=UPI001D17E99C|nr:2OG-Fe(II) oxygenase [Acinetobacter sp. ANC 4633]
MMAETLSNLWDINKIINDLDNTGFSVIDQAYSEEYLQSVHQECMHHLNEFRDAAIQNGVVSKIRSDHILWINDNLPIAEQHVTTLMHLAQELNQAFFFGIREVEAHFACYNAGEFYALHRDNPQKKNDRMISAVLYLHPEWHEDWGGQLCLQDKQQNWHILEPKPNRIALFQSDLLHEVLAAKQQRLSITAWMRSNHSIWL